jgi:transcriptional regulator GlxA family with amidase domain
MNSIERRQFLQQSAAATASLGIAASAAAAIFAPRSPAAPLPDPQKLTPPPDGKMFIAFPISEGVQVIDLSGPWEVFQDVSVSQGTPDPGMEHRHPFQPYTVSERIEVIEATDGMKLTPNYTFADAPHPRLIVVPAQSGSPALIGWLKKVAPATDTDLVTSVCTGAFQLAKAGLLDGKSATTHHQALDRLQRSFPQVHVKRGLRYVEDGKIATAGGLTSGIDLALRIVERYYGRTVAQETAEYMEYQSKSWMA